MIEIEKHTFYNAKHCSHGAVMDHRAETQPCGTTRNCVEALFLCTFEDVPFNRPFYERIGYTTLRDATEVRALLEKDGGCGHINYYCAVWDSLEHEREEEARLLRLKLEARVVLGKVLRECT